MNVELPQTEKRKKLISNLYVALAIIALLAIIGLFIGLIIWIAQNWATEVEVIRDIFIIALAIESCLFGIVLIFLLISLIRLINMIEFEIKPILEQTNETVSTLRGTTTFVSQKVVKPVAKATGYLAGFKRGVTVLFGNPRRNLPD
jgi:hypothetical protein